MLLITIDHAYKRKWVSFIVMIVTSIFPIIATLMGPLSPTTVYGAGLAQHQQTGLSKGINMMVKVKSSIVQSTQVDLVIFFTRPLTCTQDPNNCNGNIKSYAPDDKMSCSSPIPQTQTSSSAKLSWVSNGKECPYLNCNWTSVPGGCSAQTSKTVFLPSPPELSALGNVYMTQPLDFSTQSPQDKTYGFAGCIYFENWAEFPTQNTQLVLSKSGGQLVLGTLPTGLTLQKIQTILASSKNQIQQNKTGTGTGWNL
jgi:hypothetical protein